MSKRKICFRFFKFKLKDWEFSLVFRIYTLYWYLNFLPRFDVVEIVDDNDYNHIVGLWYNVHLGSLMLDIYRPQNRYLKSHESTFKA